MKKYFPLVVFAISMSTACTLTGNSSKSVNVQTQVEATERAFAKTMADRDHSAFAAFLSDETVFMAGTTVHRGRKAVTTQWEPFFKGPDAPFSWQPETVAVLNSGDLAISTGPVWDAQGTRVSTFTSIWRQEEPGVWRIVFDRGNKYCG